jgi:hypothetical protein
MRTRWSAALFAAAIAMPSLTPGSFAESNKKKAKPRLRPLSSPANTAIQSDFPEMEGSRFQERTPYEPASGSRLTTPGLSGTVPTSGVKTNAAIAAPAGSGPQKAYGQMRTTPTSAPRRIDSQANQPGASYAAPPGAITGGGARTTGVGVSPPARPDMRPRVGPRPDLPAGVSSGGEDAEVATAMSTINATEKRIERREREREKKTDAKEKGQQGMQPPQLPSGGGGDKKDDQKGGGGSGGGGNKGQPQPQDAASKAEPESSFLDDSAGKPKSGLAQSKGIDAKTATNSAELNKLDAKGAATLDEALGSGAEGIETGAANRAAIGDQMQNIFNDPYAQSRGIPQIAQRTNTAVQGGASSAHRSQGSLSSSKKDGGKTVDGVERQNKENNSRISRYRAKADKLQNVADNARTAPPSCSPSPQTFSNPSESGLRSAEGGKRSLDSNLGAANGSADEMAGHIGTLDQTVPQLWQIGKETAARNNSGNANAFLPVAAEWNRMRMHHPQLRQSIGQGQDTAQAADQAIRSCRKGLNKVRSTRSRGQTASQTINDLCRLLDGQLKQLYKKGEKKEKVEGPAKIKQGEAQIAQGQALNAISPGSGTALIQNGENLKKEGEKIKADGKKIKEKAKKKAEDIKKKMQRKARRFKRRVDRARSTVKKADGPARGARSAHRRWRVPGRMP